MVLFLTAVGLILFFGGVVVVICDPPKKLLKLISLVIFSGVVLLGGAAYVGTQHDLYRAKRLDACAWGSVAEIEALSPIKIGDRWYRIVLEEIAGPE
ncbi:hypothetical protein [Desulfoluna sp.]|uniref:hypothetical protein n=1 Tax=Desulfoluna sp. TaxID=2045199 RepID=UPI00260431A8|nr:hypothetical protein [Desulfoluna sp.]